MQNTHKHNAFEGKNHHQKRDHYTEKRDIMRFIFLHNTSVGFRTGYPQFKKLFIFSAVGLT